MHDSFFSLCGTSPHNLLYNVLDNCFLSIAKRLNAGSLRVPSSARGTAMPIKFQFLRSKGGPARSVPYLPRVGIYIDFGNRLLAIRAVPVIETLVNCISRGIAPRHASKVIKEQCEEINFPSFEQQAVIDVVAEEVAKKT
jgi:hypothetical protein